MKHPILYSLLALGLSSPALAAPIDEAAPARDPAKPALGASGQGDAQTSGDSGAFGAQGASQASTPAGQGGSQHQASASAQRPDAGISPEQARLNLLDGNVRDSMMNQPGAARQIEQLDEDGFARFDVDEDGGVARAEAGNDSFVANAMTAYDIDGNGELSEAEFTQMTQGLKDELKAREAAAKDRASDGDPEMRAAFDRIDRNDDQVLAGHEADSGSGLAKAFKTTDENSDGFISEAEFARFTEERGSSLERDNE